MSQEILEKVPEMPVGLCELLVVANIALKIKGETNLSWVVLFTPLSIAVIVPLVAIAFVWLSFKKM